MWNPDTSGFIPSRGRLGHIHARSLHQRKSNTPAQWSRARDEKPMSARRTRDLLAEIVCALEASEGAIEPRCRHFGECGGCDLQHLAYPTQLQVKRRLVERILHDLPQTSACQVLDTMPALDQWRYRNKIEFTFDARDDGGLALGFSPKHEWWRRIDIEECWLCSERMLGAALAVKSWAAGTGLSPYHQRHKQGFLRNLVLRESAATGDLVVNLVTAEGDLPHGGLLDALQPLQPTGVIRTIHAGPAAAVSFERVETLAGEPTIRERAGEVSFSLAPEAFFQTNSAMVSRLIGLVAQGATLTGGERVLDMYCGVGTLGLALAGCAREVVGVESVEAAVASARDNAAANGIRNAAFVCATAREYFREHAAEAFDVVILDPPRSGCGARVVRRLLEMRPARIVYVSCNPVALADDLALLSESYDMAPVRPVDLFPQTGHVESVVELTARHS